MAKAPASDSIMPASKMKPLLTLSKKEPVQAAIGLSSDGEGIIFLDKKAKPRKCASMLKASAAKAKIQLNGSSLRFGRAEVDPEYDAGTVRFFINKDAPGNMRVKLTEVIKFCAFQKVEINVDPSLEEEAEDGAEEQPAGAEAAAPAAKPEQPDTATLKQRLTGLVQQIPQAITADPSRKASLLELAKDGQARIAGNDIEGAVAAIQQLKEAIEAPAAPKAAAGEEPAATANYDKARSAWIAVRRQLETEIDKLRQHMLEFYEDTDIVGNLNRSYSTRVQPVLNTLDESLAETLEDAGSASEPQKRTELVTEARAAIGRYQAFLGSEALFKELDTNPFVPISIGALMNKTLTALSAALR